MKKTVHDAQTAHTVQTKISDFMSVPSQSQLDVAPTNVESQPPFNLQVETLINSPFSSGDIEMIYNDHKADSPTLTLLEEPNSISGAQLIATLLEHQNIISDALAGTVDSNIKSITTDSTIVSLSTAISSTSSIAIIQPSIDAPHSTDALNSIHMLISTTVQSTGNIYPWIPPSTVTVDENTVVEALMDLEMSTVQTLSATTGEIREEKEEARVEGSNMF